MEEADPNCVVFRFEPCVRHGRHTSASHGTTLTAYQRSDQPLAFNFFNPATDLRRGESLASHPTNLATPAEQGSANLGQTTQPFRRSDSQSRRGSFLSLPATSLLPSSSPVYTYFGARTVREPPPFPPAVGEHGRLTGMYTDMPVSLSTDGDEHKERLALFPPLFPPKILHGSCGEGAPPTKT